MPLKPWQTWGNDHLSEKPLQLLKLYIEEQMNCNEQIHFHKEFLVEKLGRNTLFPSKNHLPLTVSISLGLEGLDLGEGELNLR